MDWLRPVPCTHYYNCDLKIFWKNLKCLKVLRVCGFSFLPCKLLFGLVISLGRTLVFKSVKWC